MFKHLAINERHKHGDTLIEVTLAIGIFSMVAVAAVSVLSASTSGAEDTLETSITREVIDTQADALRFIHSAAMVDHGTATPKFSNIWDEIKKNAITIENTWNKEQIEKITQYTPDSCADDYNNEENNIFRKAFVIDPNQLGNYANKKLIDANIKSVYIDSGAKNNSSSPILAATSTYPRLVYGNNNESSEALFSSDTSGDLLLAEGIYVIAVKDSRNQSNETPDYYDFYIRTCWYGTDDSERPSTISTVIRLNDLDATKYEIGEKALSFKSNDETVGRIKSNYSVGSPLPAGKEMHLTAEITQPGFEFLGWFHKGDTEPFSKDPTYSCIIGQEGCDVSVIAKFGIEINVLNVYPDLPASNSLKTWMDKWGINEEGDSTKLLTVTPVKITDFNADPYKYLGSRGNWNYDIVVFGFWDVNNSKDLNANSAAAIRDFLNNKGGVLFGHDTLHSGTCTSHPYFKSLEDLVGVECENFGWTTTNKVKIVKSGIFTEYPYRIGSVGTVLTIPPAHRTQFRATRATVWLRFDNLPERADASNFYLASYTDKRTAYINTGHSNGQATDDERKIIANILFYLYQLR